MLIFVAIHTEILPVGTVRRVILMVPVFVMDRKQLAVPVFKLPAALCADKAMYLKGQLPVIARRLSRLFQSTYDLFNGFRAVVLLRRA